MLLQIMKLLNNLLKQINLQLWSSNNFSPYNLFKNIDPNCHGRLTIISIQNYLLKNKVSVNSDEAKVILKYFDKDGDGIINYCDFYQSIQLEDEINQIKEQTDQNTETILENQNNYLVEYFLSIITWNKVIEDQKGQIKDKYQILNHLFSNHRKICIKRFYSQISSYYKVDKQIIMKVFKLIDKNKIQKITKFQVYQTFFTRNESKENLVQTLRFEDEIKFDKKSNKSTMNTESDN